MAEMAFSLTMWKVSSPFLLCPPSSVLARCLRGAEAPAEGRFSVCWRSCVLFTTLGLWGLFCFILFFYSCSAIVILQKIKAVHSPRQKLCLQIRVALLWRGSAPFAKLAAADLWPGGCSSVGWNYTIQHASNINTAPIKKLRQQIPRCQVCLGFQTGT